MSDELERLRADLEVFERHGLIAEASFLRGKIARLEAEAADPWRDAKGWLSSWRGQGDFPVVVAYIDHLTAENARLAARVAELERHVATAVQAGNLYRQASFQSHSGHWDSTMQRGRGCLECIRANDLRKEADEMMDQEKFLDPDDPILDPARVLATAEELMWGPTVYAVMLKPKDAKPYRLKGGGK